MSHSLPLPRSYIHILILIFLVNLKVFGAVNRDSLVAIITSEASSKSTIEALNKLGSSLLFVNPDTAELLGKRAYDLARKERSYEPMVTALSTQGISYAIRGKQEQARALYELALEVVVEYEANDPDWAEATRAKFYGNLGVLSAGQGRLGEAITYYQKALDIALMRKDTAVQLMLYNNFGQIRKSQGNLPQALTYYLDGLTLAQAVGDLTHEATIYGNIGTIHYEQGDHEEAIKYYFMNIDLAKKLDNLRSVAINLNNIGVCYKEMGELVTALEYYHKTLTLAEELGIKRTIASASGNIGIVHEETGDLDKALEHYENAMVIGVELNDLQLQAVSFNKQGQVFKKMGRYNLALEKLEESNKLAEEVGAKTQLRDNFQLMSEIYEAAGRYEEAFEHMKLYTTAKDTLFNEEKSKEIGKLEARYEFEKAEEEQKRLKEEVMVAAKLAQSRRNNLQYSGILIFLVLIFSMIFMVGRFSIPIRLAEGMIFFSFLLFFEFSLVLLDPYIEEYSSGAPALKLAFNAVLAGMIFPLHAFFEAKFKKRIAANSG